MQYNCIATLTTFQKITKITINTYMLYRISQKLSSKLLFVSSPKLIDFTDLYFTYTLCSEKNTHLHFLLYLHE